MNDPTDTPGKAGPSVRTIPEGDNRPRLVCADCGFIHYENPKVIVGAVCTWEDRILLCRRAIQPRAGYWTLPAGFLELNESTIDGAKREAWEEACARIEVEGLLGVYDITHISQVHLIYRARLISPEVEAGPESQEVGLFLWSEIPWDRLAFPSVSWALDHFRQSHGQADFPARGNPEPAHGPE